MKAVIKHIGFPAGGRVAAISDVHGNLKYLKGLLAKLDPGPEDSLVLCGDMVEKGPQSLEALRYIMRLAETGRVHMLQGNCDCWQEEIDHPTPRSEAFLRRYLLSDSGGWGPGLLAQMCAEIGFPIDEDLDIARMRAALAEAFVPELDFLRGLPHVLESEACTFVHGGLPEGPPEDWDAWSCMKNDNFLCQGRQFSKWVVAGHTPVVLYGGDITCANPIVDRESRIISIDGGCVLKDDGQLNALLLPAEGGDDFSFVSYDDFPVRRVKTAQRGSEHSAYIRWGDNRVRVLERGPEFCRCRHLRTGYELDILTKYLCGGGDAAEANDCTDYLLPLEAGDEVSVVEETSRGYLCKHLGVSGWYLGELEPPVLPEKGGRT